MYTWTLDNLKGQASLISMSMKSMENQSPSSSPRSQTSPTQAHTSEQPLVSSKGTGKQEIYSSTKWITMETSTAAGELILKSTPTMKTNTQGILCTTERNTTRQQSVSGSAKMGYSPCTQEEQDGHWMEQRTESSEKICKVNSILIHLHLPCEYKVITRMHSSRMCTGLPLTRQGGGKVS